MRSTIAHDRVVWWPRVPTNGTRQLVAASDPSVPAGLPVAVDVVAKHVGRDTPQTPDTWHPVRVGSMCVWSGWVRHDPACPAAVHQSLRAYTNRRQAALWSAMVNIDPTAATPAWMFVSGRHVETLATNTQSRMAVSINQATTASPPCTWWVAADVGRIIG